MSLHDVDVAILGAGTAGMAAYRAAVAHTDRVLLIEAGAYGTTCARVGCMPSKLLIAAADAAAHARSAPGFGLRTEVEVDGHAVLARVRAERDRFTGFVTRTLEEWPARHHLRGHARFEDPHHLRVGEEIVHARNVVIATGSRPRRLPALEAVSDRVLVNDDVFSWTELPASVAVVGAGVIGLELGQALARLGVRVEIFSVGGLFGPLTDPEVQADALAAISRDLPIHPDLRALAFARTSRGVRVDHDGRSSEFEWVLGAAGRVPNVDRLGLENSGLVLDARGVPVHDPRTLRCGDGHVFVAGDASADLPLLHEAADEGRIAGGNAATWPRVEPGVRRSPLAIVFTDPQIAVVGSPRSRLVDPIVGKVSFDDQGRSRVMRRNRGRLHVFAERGSGRLLGAELAAPDGEHLAHLLAWAHQLGLTAPQMLELPFYHPVVEEGLRTALRDALAQL